MSEDLAHDAHLRAALRHAPDHALVPPSSVSQAILAAARQAHRPARATPAPPPRMRAVHASPWRTWLRRVTSPRWAGAWAAALVAALGLGLWLDLEMQPVVERPSTIVAQAPAMSASTAPAGAEAVREAQSPRAPDTVAQVSAAHDMRKAQEPAAARSKSPTESAAKAERAAPRRNEATDGLAKQVERPSEAMLQRQADAAPATPAASASLRIAESKVAGAAPSTAAMAPAPPPNPASETQDAALQRELAARRAAVPSAAELRLSAAPRADGALQSAASPALTLLQRVRADSAAGHANWTWTPPGATAPVPFDDAGQAWLQRLMQAARGRWADVPERGDATDAIEVRWWREGWPHATLRIEADGLRWFDANGRIRHAPLDAPTVQRVRTF